MQTFGVPYPEGYDLVAVRDLKIQAESIADQLNEEDLDAESTKEIIALIAYMQRLGTDIKGKNNIQFNVQSTSK